MGEHAAGMHDALAVAHDVAIGEGEPAVAHLVDVPTWTSIQSPILAEPAKSVVMLAVVSIGRGSTLDVVR